MLNYLGVAHSMFDARSSGHVVPRSSHTAVGSSCIQAKSLVPLKT